MGDLKGDGLRGRYRAFGLALASEFPLPDMAEGKAVLPDVTIRRESLTDPNIRRESGRFTRVNGGLSYLHWDEAGTFAVRGGTEIGVNPSSGADEDRLRALILGPVMAASLHQRGLVVLHGSAVRFGHGEEGRAVAFLGDSGRGKSTTAAALCAQGYGLLADDLAVLRVDDASRQIPLLPAYPGVKLRPDARHAILNGERPPDRPSEQRRYVRLASFNPDPVPLGWIGLLEEGPEVKVIELTRREALIGLMRRHYWADFLAPDESQRLFRQLSAVARRIPVRRLVRPHDLKRLDDFVEELKRASCRSLP